jgi:hypothetical protein
MVFAKICYQPNPFTDMQFIDFKKEHFSYNAVSGNYIIQLSKDEIGYENIEVLKKKDDHTYAKADYEIVDDAIKIIIKMKEPEDIRVNF